jgi:2,3-bisphosphoglycerate-dependent phosphoglycerate mutase
MSKLVMLRHGRSAWNNARRFTGWADVDLSADGREEAAEAGELLKARRLGFDVCFTSVLKRATETLDIVLETLHQPDLPIHRSWRLNERHYGALEGLNREEMAKQCGRAQVIAWQQEFDVPPPLLSEDDERYPGHDPRYAELPESALPRGETIKAVRERVLPYWQDHVVPEIRPGKRVLIVAHGNSLRALTTYLDGVAQAEVGNTKRPLTGEPFVYELDQAMRAVSHDYLRHAITFKRLARIAVNEFKTRVTNA